MAGFEQKISDLDPGSDGMLVASAQYAADTGTTGITKKFNFDQMAVQTIARLKSYGYVQSNNSPTDPLVTKDYVDHNRGAQLFPSATGGIWTSLAMLQAGPWYNLAGLPEAPSAEEWARVDNAAGFDDIYTYNGSAWVKTGTDSFNMTSDQAAALNSMITRALRDKVYDKVGGTNSGNTLAIEERAIATPTADDTDPVATTGTNIQNWLQLLTNKILGIRNKTADAGHAKTFYVTGALAAGERIKIECTPEPGDLFQINYYRGGPYTLYGFSTAAIQTTTNTNCLIMVLSSSVAPGNDGAKIEMERVSDGIIFKLYGTNNPDNMTITLMSKNPIGSSSIVTTQQAGTMPLVDPRQDADEKPNNCALLTCNAGMSTAVSDTAFIGSGVVKGQFKVLVDSENGRWQMYSVYDNTDTRLVSGVGAPMIRFRWDSAATAERFLIVENLSGEKICIFMIVQRHFQPYGTGSSTPPGTQIPLKDMRPLQKKKITIAANSETAISGIDWALPLETKITAVNTGVFEETYIRDTTKMELISGVANVVSYYYRSGDTYSLIVENASTNDIDLIFESHYQLDLHTQAGDITLGTLIAINDIRPRLEKNVTSLPLGSGDCLKYKGFVWSDSNNPARNRVIITGPGGYAEYQEVDYSGQTVMRHIGGFSGVIEFRKDNTDGQFVAYNKTSMPLTITFITDYTFDKTTVNTSYATATELTYEDCLGPRTRMLPIELAMNSIVSINPVTWGSGLGNHVIIASSGTKTQTIVVLDDLTARIVAGSDELINIFNDTSDTNNATMVVQNLLQNDPVILTIFTPYFLNPTIMSVGTITADMDVLTLQDARDKDPNSIQAFTLAISEVAKFEGMQWIGNGHTRIVATIKPASGTATFQEFILYSATEARLINGAASCINIYRDNGSGALLVQNISSTDAITVMIETAFNWRATKVSGTTNTATQLTAVDCRVASGGGGGGGGMALVVGAGLNNLASFDNAGQVKDSGIASYKVAQILNTTAKPITFSCTGDELHDKLIEYGQYFASYNADGLNQTVTINITADATDFSSLTYVPIIPGYRGLRFIINGGNKKVFCPRCPNGGGSLQIASAKLILGANNGWHNFQDMDFLYIQGCSVDASGVPANTARISFNGIKKLYVSISSFTKTQAGNDVSIVINNQDVRILGAACNYNGSAWSSGTNCRFYIDSNVPNAVFSDANNGGTGIFGSAIVTDFRANRQNDTYQRRLTASATDNMAAFNAYGHAVDSGIKKSIVSQEVDTAATPITISCTGNELQAKLLQFVKKQPPQTTEGVLQEVEITITTGQTQFAAQNQPVIPDTRGIKFKILSSGTRRSIMMPYIGEGANVEFSNMIIRTTDDDIYGIKNANHVLFDHVMFDASACQSGSNIWVDDTKDIKFILIEDFDFGDPSINTVFDISGSNVFLDGMTTTFGETLKFAGGSNSKIYITDRVGATVLSNFANGDGGFMDNAIIFDNRANHDKDTYIRKPAAATAGIIPTYKANGQLDLTGIDPANLLKEMDSSMYSFSCTADELRGKLLDYIKAMPRQGTAAQGGALQGINITITADATVFTQTSIPFIPDTRGNFFIINLNNHKILMPSIGRESSMRITGPGSLVIRENANITWDYGRTIELNNVDIQPQVLGSSAVSSMVMTGCRNVMFTNVTFSGSMENIMVDAIASNIRIYGANTMFKRSQWRKGMGTTIAIDNTVDNNLFADLQNGGDGGITNEAIITDFRNNYRRDDSFVRTDFMRALRSPVINPGMEWKINLTDVWKPNGHGYLKVVMKPVNGSRGGYIDGGIRWEDGRGGIFDQWRQEDNVISFIFDTSSDLTIENPTGESWQVSLYYFAA